MTCAGLGLPNPQRGLLAPCVLVVVWMLMGCREEVESPEASTQAEVAQTAQLGSWGIETRFLSDRVAPGDDFYDYVNQGWIESTEIPTGFPVVSSFTEVFLKTEDQTAAIIESLCETNAAAGSPEQQISALHASYLDLERREALGLSMLEAELAELLAAPSREDIARQMGRVGYPSMFRLDIDIDSGNPQRYVPVLSQSGLGLPGRDYYLRDDAPFPGHREAYIAYISGVFERAGIDTPEQRARSILDVETALAKAHWTPAQARDILLNYHLMSVGELLEFAPGFDWQAFLGEAGLEGVDELLVATDTAIQRSARIVAQTPLETLRSYLAFHLLDDHAPLLSAEWDAARFAFYGQRLSGIAEQRALDARAIEFVNRRLGEPLGRLYVERYFPPESRAQMQRMAKHLRAALHDRLTRLDWMDDETRAAALRKLSAFREKIGFPDVWQDMSGIEISASDLAGNVRRIDAWHHDDALEKLAGPVREWEWLMSPQTINAYYSPDRNEIVFPAAILQPPFFDPHADPAVNFGAIGVVIGHEIGHGFDDQGSRYDDEGALRNWWSDASRAAFEKRTALLAAQFDAYSPIEGVSVNGQLTLGENIGDLGGLAIAHDAYQRFVAEEYDGNAPLIDGFTGNQRLFLSYAQIWRSKMTEDRQRQLLLVDPHSPSLFRVNGIVRNLTPWYEAFDVDAEQALYLAPEDRVHIW
jgi:endothelin-converting enzyme/putative endopeptidase